MTAREDKEIERSSLIARSHVLHRDVRLSHLHRNVFLDGVSASCRHFVVSSHEPARSTPIVDRIDGQVAALSLQGFHNCSLEAFQTPM